MAEITPTAGQQNPSKYPRVGPNYLKYGEQPGYDYYYWDDRYHPNKEAQLKSVGQEAPKEQTLTDQLVPIAAITGGSALAVEGAKQVIPGIKGLLGGEAAKTTATEGAKAGLETFGPEMGAEYGTSAVLPGAEGAATTGIMSNAAGMGVGPLAAIAGATYLGGKSAYDIATGKGKAWGKSSTQDKIGRGLLGVATGGLSEIGNKLLNGHKSTSDRQQGRWDSLTKSGSAPEWASANGVNQDQGVDDAKLKSGNLSGRDVWATSGMFDTFGGNWANMYDESKREQIAAQMLKEGLFDTKKGVTYVTDKERAKQIAEEIAGGKAKTPGVQQVSTNAAKGLLGG